MTKPTRPTVPEVSTSPGSGDAFPISTRTAPSIMCQVSHDNGMTWVAMPTRPLGETGEYRQRVQWHRLGSGYSVVMRFAVTDAVPLAFLDLQVEAQGSA